MSKLIIVVCTKTGSIQDFVGRPIQKSLQLHHDQNNGDIDIKIFPNNTRGLSTVYNEVLKDPKNRGKIALFVHDDVELEDLFLLEKLIHSPYSITGVAGARSFNKKSQLAAWHLSAPREDYVGEAAHFNSGKVWTTVFGPTKSRALVLDGLFLSCKIDNLVDKEVYFDEDFNFHFYDIAFCLRANQKGVTCGVLPIRVVHHGLGDSMNSEEWKKSNELFKQKYCV
jgi:GT2 family glycosyltransferase